MWVSLLECVSTHEIISVKNFRVIFEKRGKGVRYNYVQLAAQRPSRNDHER